MHVDVHLVVLVARAPRSGAVGPLPVVPEAMAHHYLAAPTPGSEDFMVQGGGEGWVADGVEPVDGTPLAVGGVEAQSLGVVVGRDEASRNEGSDGGDATCRDGTGGGTED